jgi:hypothetical protein|nr:MAG TPA: hypothetical protein [Caudoviricetes sp.]
MGTTTEKLTYLQGTKDAIKNAIEAKGVEVPEGTTFREYAEKVGEIQTGEYATIKLEGYNQMGDRYDELLKELNTEKDKRFYLVDFYGNVIADGVEVKTEYKVRVPTILVAGVNLKNSIDLEGGYLLATIEEISILQATTKVYLITKDCIFKYYEG